MKNFLKKLPIAIILCLTLALLVFVSYGEARRTFFKYRLETCVLQTDTVLDIINPFLKAGFPLTMYGGYESQADGIFEANQDVESVQVKDFEGKVIFERSHILEKDQGDYTPSKIEVADNENVSIFESARYFKIRRSLNPEGDKSPGIIEIALKKNIADKYLRTAYKPAFWILGIACVILTLAFYIVTAGRWKNNYKNIFIKILYMTIFVSMGILVTIITLRIYDNGVRGKTMAIGKLLATRLTPVKELGISYDDLSGIEEILGNFKNCYDFVDSVSLTSGIAIEEEQYNNMKILYDSSPGKQGTFYLPDFSSQIIYQESLNIRDSGDNSGTKIVENLIIVSVPKREVRNAILNSIINFLALIVGSSLIAMIFLNVGLAFAESLSKKEIKDKAGSFLDPSLSLQLIKAAYFLIVFISAMAVPFLPLLVQELNNGQASALPFTIYYLFFALVLIPSGHAAARGKVKEIMAIGFIAEIAGCILVAYSETIPLLTLGRAVSGLGQGCFLIGFQSYVLSVTPIEKRTQGAAIKVIARNSALIGGTAIGSLLYVFMGYRSLFILSSGISILGFIFLFLMVPRVKPNSAAMSKKLELRHIPKVFQDRDFLKVLFLTGIPAKMGITGVVNYAVPLLMVALSFTQEDIGRYLMLFFIVSMITTKLASRQADKSGNTQSVLFLSTLAGGIGMIMIGFQTIVLKVSAPVVTISGLMLIAVANGLISAPIVTQITKTRSAEQFGYSPVLALYTFLERFGHILGPMVLGLIIMVLKNKTSMGIGSFGIITIVLGIIFLLVNRKGALTLRQVKQNSNIDYFEDFQRQARWINSTSTLSENLVFLNLNIPFNDIQTKNTRENNLTEFVAQVSLMQELIKDGKGRLLRFRGSSLQAIWQSAESKSTTARLVCEQAKTFYNRYQKIDEIGDRLNEARIFEGRIGIHVEDGLLLNLKKQAIKEDIIVGSAISVSEHISRLNYQYGTKIIVSEDLKKILPSEYVCRILDKVRVPGKEEKMTVYELCAFSEDEISEASLDFIHQYEEAFKAYDMKNWDEALIKLRDLKNTLEAPDMSVDLLYHKTGLFLDNPKLTEMNRLLDL